jgi:hypothetical protein
MDIKLNFINNSNDQNNSQIVIFQKNVNTTFDELAVAWQVIQNCGQGNNHPFVYPMTMQVSAADSYGNYTPQLDAENGQLFSVQNDGKTGDQLSLTKDSAGKNDVQVRNDLEKGAIDASIYKAGKLLAQKTSIPPNEKATFEFKPTIWIGAASQVVEGQFMNSAIISNVNTELDLLGLASADIVLTGGGPGPSSTALTFTLTNKVMR